MTTKTTDITPNEFLSFVTTNNYTLTLKHDRKIISITSRFTPNNKEEFIEHESKIVDALLYLPVSGGSLWGSTSDSVGGCVALKNGVATFNISFTKGLRWFNKLAKLMS